MPAPEANENREEPEETTQQQVEEKLPKLSQALVDQKWKELRGEAPGPDDKAVTRAIDKSDKQKKGALNPPEAIRITKAFIKKAGAVNLGISSHETQKIFHYLD